MYKSYYPKASEIDRKWVLVDANGQTLGRIATRIAHVLLGKHKPTFTPGVEMGDYVVVINAQQITVTGQKTLEKMYHKHSGYPGGLKGELAKDLLKRRPEVVVERAVKGMLPKNRLGRKMFKKLFVYAGSEHPHTAQKPTNLVFNKIK